MSVTGEQPTRIGQRVQEIFTNSRGWVRELGHRHNVEVAVIEWDDKQPTLGDDDRVFPLDALQVVQVISVDWDRWVDPGLSPLVSQVTHPDPANPDLRRARYEFDNGAMANGVSAARIELIKRSATS